MNFTKAVQVKEDPESYNNLGCAMSEKELYDDAFVAFLSALELEPKNKSALWNLTCVLIETF